MPATFSIKPYCYSDIKRTQVYLDPQHNNRRKCWPITKNSFVPRLMAHKNWRQITRFSIMQVSRRKIAENVDSLKVRYEREKDAMYLW